MVGDAYDTSCILVLLVITNQVWVSVDLCDFCKFGMEEEDLRNSGSFNEAI